ncbi:MAG: hydrogenase maturation protease [Myxococcota bacterium]
MTAPVLVFGYGNPSRGDDALGPEFVRALESREADAIARGELEVLTDFQLQVEHALDLRGRRRVYFVDANVEGAELVRVRRLEPRRDESYSSHAVSPESLLHTFEAVEQRPAPECFVIELKGERFELGEALSSTARAALELGLTRVPLR